MSALLEAAIRRREEALKKGRQLKAVRRERERTGGTTAIARYQRPVRLGQWEASERVTV